MQSRQQMPGQIASAPATGSLFRRARRVLWIVLGNVLVFVLFLCVMEGAASLFLLARDVARSDNLSERRHTEHDPQIGWVNVPYAYVPNIYGPGTSLRTNGQRFRNRHDFDREVPQGKRRIICSGDSFTLGWGVDDADTWCSALESLDPRLEVVNMGQGGYGLDQAFLWYWRDAAHLRHDVHVFAFIFADFQRMAMDDFFGYPKPRLELEDGRLVVRNLPVPRPSVFASWYRVNHDVIEQMRIMEVVRQVRPPSPSPALEVDSRLKDENLRPIVSVVLRELKRLNDQRSSRLVLLFLPATGADPNDSARIKWERFLEGEALSLGVAFVDLIPELAKVSPAELSALYRSQSLGGHLSATGNAWVAKHLYARLKEDPTTAALLADKVDNH